MAPGNRPTNNQKISELEDALAFYSSQIQTLSGDFRDAQRQTDQRLLKLESGLKETKLSIEQKFDEVKEMFKLLARNNLPQNQSPMNHKVTDMEANSLRRDNFGLVLRESRAKVEKEPNESTVTDMEATVASNSQRRDVFGLFLQESRAKTDDRLSKIEKELNEFKKLIEEKHKEIDRKLCNMDSKRIAMVECEDLVEALLDAGNEVSYLHTSDEFLSIIDNTELLLRKVKQNPPLSVRNALCPLKYALVSSDLLYHSEYDVRIEALVCVTEIMRILTPEAPYSDDQAKAIFRLTLEAFEILAEESSRNYKKAETRLVNMAKVKACLRMLDLDCVDLLTQMFRQFLRILRDDHPQVVFSSMELIMTTLMDVNDIIFMDLLEILMVYIQNENQIASHSSLILAEKVLRRCAPAYVHDYDFNVSSQR